MATTLPDPGRALSREGTMRTSKDLGVRENLKRQCTTAFAEHSWGLRSPPDLPRGWVVRGSREHPTGEQETWWQLEGPTEATDNPGATQVATGGRKESP